MPNRAASPVHRALPESLKGHPKTMLSAEQRDWVGTRAAVVFGLTASQTRILLLALDAEMFSFQDIATEVSITREGARLALRSLERRDLIQLRPYKPSLPRGPLVAEPGEGLLAMFDRLLTKTGSD